MSLEFKSQPERVILILSPCRSGSSSLLNSFASAGYHSIYQPIKASLRRELAGDNQSILITPKTSTIVIKETLGPYRDAEVQYNPIQVLIDRGISPSSISVIALVRQPEECLTSWIVNFKDPDLSLFGKAYQTVINDCLAAQSLGITIVPIRYEDLAEHDALQAMMSALGLPFTTEMINWDQSGEYRPGQYSFEYIEQSLYSDEVGLQGARGDKLRIKIPSANATVAPDNQTKQASELGLANQAYTKIYEAFGWGGPNSPKQPTLAANLATNGQD